MQKEKIPDKLITMASADEVVEQYSAWVQKIVNKYVELTEQTGACDIEDMFQAGIVGLLDAQRYYDPDRGCSFLTYSYKPIRNAILSLFGYNDPERYRPKKPLIYMDKPVTGDDDEITLADRIKDPNIRPFDERLIEQESQQETVEVVRSAVDRLKNEKQKEVITRCWLNDQDRVAAAADMGITVKALYAIDNEGRHKLRRDIQLKRYAIPFLHVGVSQFNTTWESSVERAVLLRERQYDKIFGDGAFLAAGRRVPEDEQPLPDELIRQWEPPERSWSDKQALSYMRRMVAKHGSQEEQKPDPES